MSTRIVEFEAADGYTYTAELGDPKQSWWNIYDSDGQPQTSCYVTSVNYPHGPIPDPFDLEVREQCVQWLKMLEEERQANAA